jgi:hypothetical protein
MPSCQVYGNKPDSGPGQLSAQAARDNVNEAHTTWAVTMNWNSDRTIYTSAVATADNLVEAFSAQFPGYNVVEN